MDTLLQDARYAVRSWMKAPGFTLVTLVTMATAIGANATVFSFVNALLLSPQPGVSSPSTLVSVYTSDFSSGAFGATSYPDFESIQERAGAFAQLAAYSEPPPTLLRIGAQTDRVRTLSVTATFFESVGVHPVAGRLLGPGDTAGGAPPVAVIGERLWERSFGSSPMLGQAISINGTAHTVVGIVPASFTGLNLGAAYEIWTPLAPQTGAAARGNRGLSMIGRLGSGADIMQAQAQLDGIAAQLAAAFPDTNLGTLARPEAPRPFRVVQHTRLHPDFRGEVQMLAAVLLSAVGLVLLMACTNVAGLLLSRATARHREIAVRLAVGAGRARIFRQMLTESLLLGLVGGALGLMVTLWTADALPSFFPPEQARLLAVAIDWRVLTFTAVAALISGLVFGVAPAIQGLKASPAEALRAGSQRTSDLRATARLRKALVGAQIALAFMLLVSAVLLTRSLSNGLNADLGFTTRQAVLSTVELPRSITAEAARPYFDAVLESVGALPGVEAAAWARFVPIAGTSRRGFTMEGYVPREGEDTELHFNSVSRNYFATIGMNAYRGRLFEDADRSGRAVAIVNETLAARYFNGNAVGRRLVDSGGRSMEIVGVVRADRRLDLTDPSAPIVFYLLDQQFNPRMIAVVRTSGDAALLADTVRRTIAAINPDAAVFRTVTLEAHREEALTTNRLAVALVLTCGGMALTLAVVGIYGVVAFSVARRRREIGVRVALGATPWQVLKPLLTEHGVVVCAGLAVGTAGALLATRLLDSMLYGISATHPGTYVLVIAVVGGVATLASVLPASRATRVNPIAALRQD